MRLQGLLDAHRKVVVAAKDDVGQVVGGLEHLLGDRHALLDLPIGLIEARVGHTVRHAGVAIRPRATLGLDGSGQAVDEGRLGRWMVGEHAVDEAVHGLVVVGAHRAGALELVVDGDHTLAEAHDVVHNALAHVGRPCAVALDDEAVVGVVVAKREHLERALLGLVVGILSRGIEYDELDVVARREVALHAPVEPGHDLIVPVERQECDPLHGNLRYMARSRLLTIVEDRYVPCVIATDKRDVRLGMGGLTHDCV